MLPACLRPALVAVICAAIGASLAGGAEPVTVTRLEGKSLSGELSIWTTAKVTIRDDDREVSFVPAELLSLRWGEAPDGMEIDGAQVELVDGTLLPMTAYEVSGRDASLLVARPGGANEKIGLPLKSIRAVRMVPLDQELSAQWEEVVEQDVASDVLVVLKREGKSLDYVEGIMGDVTAENVTFTLDGDEIEVNRSRVAGILYFRDGGEPRDKAVCIVHGRGGMRSYCKTVELDGDQLNMVTPAGATISWGLSDAYFADFSDGKLAFLSDLDIATEAWKPLVAWPTSLKIAASYGDVRRDRSPFGGPLTIRYPARPSENVLAREESFEKGLSIRSRTELAYRLPAGFRRFVAVAGIEPSTSASGDVLLTIEGDGRPLLETEVAGDEGPQEIDLDISGVKRLAIIVDYGQNLDTGDWLNICNARLMK